LLLAYEVVPSLRSLHGVPVTGVVLTDPDAVLEQPSFLVHINRSGPLAGLHEVALRFLKLVFFFQFFRDQHMSFFQIFRPVDLKQPQHLIPILCVFVHLNSPFGNLQVNINFFGVFEIFLFFQILGVAC
jgi:hypothetical protein